jgi:hypothetical protein
LNLLTLPTAYGSGFRKIINEKKWEQTTGVQLAALDTQASEKLAELEHYRNLVALH